MTYDYYNGKYQNDPEDLEVSSQKALSNRTPRDSWLGNFGCGALPSVRKWPNIRWYRCLPHHLRWSSPLEWCSGWILRRGSQALSSSARSGSVLTSPPVVSTDVSRQRARTSSPRYRRPSAHSSVCSASTAPTSRTIAARLGQIPTASEIGSEH